MNKENYNDFLKAKDFAKTNRKKEALLIFERLLEEEPEDKRIKYEYLKLVVKLGDKDKALKYLIPWSQSDEKGERDFALLSLGKLAVSENNEKEALEYLMPLIKDEGNKYFPALYELGSLYFNLKNYQEATEYLSLSICSQQRNIVAFSKYKLGVSYMEIGSLEKAKEEFIWLLSGTSKDRSLALVKLGQIEARCGNYLESKKYYEDLALMDNPKDKVFSKLGIALLESELGDITIAESNLEELIDNPLINRFYVIFELSKVKIKMRKFGQARHYLNMLLESDNPMDKDFATFQIALIEERVGNVDKAASIFEDTNFADNEYYLVRIGKIKAKAGEYEEALEVLEPLLNSEDKNIVILTKNEIAKLEVKFGNYLKARELYKEVYEEGSLRDKTFAMMELGILSLNIEDYENAEVYLKSLIDNDFIGEKAKFFYGKLLARTGRVSEAIEMFKSVNIEKTSLVHFELLKLYVQSKDYEKALNEFSFISSQDFFASEAKKYLTYIKYKLGNNVSCDDYFSSQLVDYDIARAISLTEENRNIDGNYFENCRFDSDLSMEELYNEVLDVLDDLNVKHIGIYDEYIYDFGANIGDFYSYRTPFIKIVALAGTRNILSIQPIYSKHLNAIKKNKYKVRVK